MPMMRLHCPHCTLFHAIGPSVPGKRSENPFWIVSQHVNAQHRDVTFLCPRRTAESTPAMRGQRDFWCVEPNGDKTCSYCGSLSEDDVKQIIGAFVAGKPGYHFATTDKPDKIYVSRPGVKTAGQGGIKFLLQHLTRGDSGRPALWQLFDRAIARELAQG